MPPDYTIVSFPRPNDFQLRGFKLHTKQKLDTMMESTRELLQEPNKFSTWWMKRGKKGKTDSYLDSAKHQLTSFDSICGQTEREASTGWWWRENPQKPRHNARLKKRKRETDESKVFPFGWYCMTKQTLLSAQCQELKTHQEAHII